MEKSVYQMFILGTGEYLDYALKKGLGGVIFFTADIQSETQFCSLIKNIKAKSTVPPFLSIDQEGGRVERTENIYDKRLSPFYAYQKGVNYLIKQTEELSSELKNFGINLNYAPCADVNTNPKNPIIGERSFSDNPKDVINGVNTVTSVYKKNGIIPCIKHYPGHGDADKDSHLTLPRIDLPLEKMEKIHILPFKNAIENDIDMIMVAHLHCTCFDKDIIPASLSKNAIKYLRDNLKFKGVIISDDMVMKGVQAFGITESIIKGIEAGLDMFIFREADEQTINAINQVVSVIENDTDLKQKVINSNVRINKLKKQYNIIKQTDN